MTSPRGSISLNNCYAEQEHICQMNSPLCGPHGICIPEHDYLHLYSCLCEEGFTGKKNSTEKLFIYLMESLISANNSF